jgi:NAD(P)-dependent dehydrogenase (short-subunit alcohol dehydrogenase family)
MPGLVIIGAGPGLGLSIARRFAREGLPITLVARSADRLRAAADALAPTGVPVLALTAAQVAPSMAGHGGTFIITGGMPTPDPAHVSLSLGKAGVRALVTLLDQQYGPAGLHVATVTVTDAVVPGTDFDPTTSPSTTGD